MTSAKKGWSYCSGERGRNRVRVYEDNRTGIILAEFYERVAGSTKSKRKRVSLGHRDREQAKQQADDMASGFGKRKQARPLGNITLQQLFDIYCREVTPEKAESKRRHDRACAEMFGRFFGSERTAKSVCGRDWDRFIRERRNGKIRPAKKVKASRVRDRQIAYDLKWLLSVLNWATRAGDGEGGGLLDKNPLKKLPLPTEKNARRPLITQARFEAMLEVADTVDWRLKVALSLANETGHRIGAVRKLRWSDIDLRSQTVRWRASSDKRSHEHSTPLSDAATAVLMEVQRRSLTIGEAWILPSPKAASRPCSRHLVKNWWYRAETAAELEHVNGLGWHSLRRKFATELKEIPLKDLCELGGWKSHETILRCYQSADEDTMREALKTRKTLRVVGAK